MAYRIALNFEDGATCFIDCDAGEKVLDAAYRNKINLPMSCLGGVCGTCKRRCELGEYDLGRKARPIVHRSSKGKLAQTET